MNDEEMDEFTVDGLRTDVQRLSEEVGALGRLLATAYMPAEEVADKYESKETQRYWRRVVAGFIAMAIVLAVGGAAWSRQYIDDRAKERRRADVQFCLNNQRTNDVLRTLVDHSTESLEETVANLPAELSIELREAYERSLRNAQEFRDFTHEQLPILDCSDLPR